MVKPQIDNDSDELQWIENVHINKNVVEYLAKEIESKVSLISNENRLAWLLRMITMIDLTTLNADETDSSITSLCLKAARPLASNLIAKLGFDYETIHTPAVCVYPSKVKNAFECLKKMDRLSKINIASVATDFPSGQTPLSTRLDEIKYAIDNGATEIDVVIDRGLVISQKWKELYEELHQMRKICGNNVHMKTILSTGQLGTLTNVYKASMVAMMAGSDFIKTSTGKESVNAVLPVGIVMTWAIQDFYNKTNKKIGLKPAGGIRTPNEGLSWMILVKENLGNEWLNSHLFRIGASGLLTNIESELHESIFQTKPKPYDLL